MRARVVTIVLMAMVIGLLQMSGPVPTAAGRDKPYVPPTQKYEPVAHRDVDTAWKRPAQAGASKALERRGPLPRRWAAVQTATPAQPDRLDVIPQSGGWSGAALATLDGTGGAKDTLDGRYGVRLVDPAVAGKLGVAGLVFEVTAEQGSDSRAALSVNYRPLVELGGADWASRLQLSTLPACALTAPEKPACRRTTPLADSRNDAAAQRVTATLDEVAVGEVTAASKTSDAPSRTAVASAATLVAASPGPGGSQGTYLASSLQPSGSWSQGGSSGSFGWSYPVATTQPASGTVAPSVGLSYSSAGVDGMNSNTNPQASWTGLGFDYQPGYIERTFRNCKEATPSSTDKGLCWAGDILTMHLPGGGTQALVVDSDTGQVRPEGDGGEKVERLSGAATGAVGGEYWRVTTKDGTRYTFGASILPGGTATTATKSAWNVPVHGGTASDGCAAARCTRTWRWNLDMVEDVHRNVAAYYYAKETNYFIPSGATTRVAYDRGGYLSRIDYGIVNTGTSIYTVANPPNRVTFTVEERCNKTATITCTDAQFTTTNQANWPDVPIDQNCNASGTCNINWPTFWTRKRLATITSSYFTGSAYSTVDSYSLGYAWSPSSSTPALELTKITRTATAAGQTLTLPPVSLGYGALESRVKGYKSLPDMGYDRLQKITTETGSQISVTYSGMDSRYDGNSAPWCTATSVPTDQDNNTTECYPVNWTPPFTSTPTLDYFHKYVVAAVHESDPNGLSPTRRTVYKYSGPGWHFDDNEVVKPAQRTWSQWRGYRSVETSTGNTAWLSDNGTTDETTRSRTTYYLGENGDRKSDGSTSSVSFTDSRGGERTDYDRFAGQVAETQTFAGATELTNTRSWPSSLATTATRTRTGLPALSATVVATTKTITSTMGTGPGSADLVTTTTTDYEPASSTEPFLQRPAQVVVSPSGTAAATCTATSYADNATTWVRGATAVVSTYAHDPELGCQSSPLIARTRNYYDGKTSTGGSNVTAGDVTKTETAADQSGGAVRYATSSMTYDSVGRVKSSTVYPDGADHPLTARTTSMAYTTSTGGMLTGLTTTVPPMAGITGAVSSTQTFDPARGILTRSSDIAGRVTSATFDALGRYTAVWKPGRVQGTDTASTTYAYQLSTGVPLAVTTKNLVDPGNGATPTYDMSVQILDSRGTPRQTQADAAGGGRVITDTFVDSHGWVVATNDRWYASGVPSTTVISADKSGIDARTTTTYDQAGRPTKVRAWRRAETTPVSTTTTVYGGDRTTVIPPSGAVAATTLTDALGRTTELRRYTESVSEATFPGADANRTTYAYTPAGALRSMTTAAGTGKAATWTNSYDLLGRQVRADDPDSGTTTTTYDDTGAVLSTTDAANRTVSSTYDAWGRPTARYAGAPGTGTKLADWTYDTLVKGELTSSASYVRDIATGTTRTYKSTVVGYNVLGQPTGTDLTLDVPGLQPTYATRATYTSTGLPATSTLAPTRDAVLDQGAYSERLKHWYSRLGLETGLTGNNAYVSDATYTPFREASQYVLGVNNATSALTYTRDPHHRWITNTLLSGQLAPPQVENVAASYDAAGNLTRTVDTQGPAGSPTQTTCYDYDHLQQLTDAWTATDGCAGAPQAPVIGGVNPFWQSWTHDAAGSRETQTLHTLPGQSGEDVVTTYANGVTDHAHALASSTTTGTNAPATTGVRAALPATQSATYTPTGATDTLTTPDGDTAFTYRDDGSIATITAPDGGITELVNDADGNRLLRIDRHDGTTDTTLYLPGQQVRLNDTGTTKTLTTHRYYSLGGQQIAVRKDNDNPVFTLTDPHGTAQVTYDPFSNTTNPPVQRRALDPYGNELGQSSAPTAWIDDRTFLNKPLNPVTGLVDLGARQYDATSGRFTSVDPLLDIADPLQANGYNYANNNPIRYSDPTGTRPSCVDLTGCAASGSGVVSPDPQRAGGWTSHVGEDSWDNPHSIDKEIKNAVPKIGTMLSGAVDVIKSTIVGVGSSTSNPVQRRAAQEIASQGTTSGWSKFSPEFQKAVLLVLLIVPVGGPQGNAATHAALAAVERESTARVAAGTATRATAKAGGEVGRTVPGGLATNTPIGPGWFPYGSNKIPSGWSGPGMTKKFRQDPAKEGFVWRGPNQSSVRIDRGNPTSPYPSQQVDHVVINDGGRIVGRDGQLLPPGSRISDFPDQAHIPLSEWTTWGSWNGL